MGFSLNTSSGMFIDLYMFRLVTSDLLGDVQAFCILCVKSVYIIYFITNIFSAIKLTITGCLIENKIVSNLLDSRAIITDQHPLAVICQNFEKQTLHFLHIR